MNKSRVFDIDKFSITLLTPVPIDISSGISTDNDSVKLEKQSKELVKFKTGLGGEVLVSEQFSSVHFLSIVFLPIARAVQILETLRIAKTQFGILINNNSAPRYKGIASECRILNKPDFIQDDSGFKNQTWKFIMTDYLEIYTGDKLSL
jgi:hypothetical protein